MFKTYYNLTKPGIIYGNAITCTAGFLLASKGHINYVLLLMTVLGTSLVIASACVFNNYIDRRIDAKMDRTKKRALVSGLVSAESAIFFGSLLGTIGFIVLYLYTNSLVVLIGLIALVDYVVLYGVSKRRSVHGTLVGSIAGAAPPVAGYCAVTNHFDTGAILLFLIMAFWQMPHFYAIAMYRLKDYKAAGLPVLPVKKGMENAKIQIILYIVAFTIATACLTLFGYTGYAYLVVVTLVSLAWLFRGLQGLKTKDNTRWARKMFLFSLVVTLTLSFMLSVGTILP